MPEIALEDHKTTTQHSKRSGGLPENLDSGLVRWIWQVTVHGDLFAQQSTEVCNKEIKLENLELLKAKDV